MDFLQMFVATASWDKDKLISFGVRRSKIVSCMTKGPTGAGIQSLIEF